MWDVYHDYNPPAPYDTMFDPDYSGNVTSENFTFSDRIRPTMDTRDLDHILALYDGEIRYTDYYVDQILDVVKELGEFDNTIVAVTSDHGDEFFEHGDKGHANTLYEEVIRIPLVVRFPEKIPAGRRVEGQVRLMDVAPTLLSLAGVKQPTNFARSMAAPEYVARDLAPFMLDENTDEGRNLVAFGSLYDRSSYIRTQTTKVIESLEEDNGVEVYDLAADPGEQINLGIGSRAAAVRLRETLRDWRGANAHLEGVSKGLAVSADDLNMLRSLGYVD